MAEKSQEKTSLTGEQRIDLWEWLKANMPQTRIDKERLGQQEIADRAGNALGFSISHFSIAQLLVKLGLKTPIIKARDGTEQFGRLDEIERKLRQLYADLGKSYD